MTKLSARAKVGLYVGVVVGVKVVIRLGILMAMRRSPSRERVAREVENGDVRIQVVRPLACVVRSSIIGLRSIGQQRRPGKR